MMTKRRHCTGWQTRGTVVQLKFRTCSSLLTSSGFPRSIWIAATSSDEPNATTRYMPRKVGMTPSALDQCAFIGAYSPHRCVTSTYACTPSPASQSPGEREHTPGSMESLSGGGAAGVQSLKGHALRRG